MAHFVWVSLNSRKCAAVLSQQTIKLLSAIPVDPSQVAAISLQGRAHSIMATSVTVTSVFRERLSQRHSLEVVGCWTGALH